MGKAADGEWFAMRQRCVKNTSGKCSLVPCACVLMRLQTVHEIRAYVRPAGWVNLFVFVFHTYTYTIYMLYSVMCWIYRLQVFTRGVGYVQSLSPVYPYKCTRLYYYIYYIRSSM